MDQSTLTGRDVKTHFSARVPLVALGIKLHQMHYFEPIEQRVKIAQKTVKYTPTDKLVDGFISLLTQAHGLVEINKRVRPDPALSAAFGRQGCAEQSVVQDTLDACTPDNVLQMQQAFAALYQRHSQGYRHDYTQAYQLLEVDLSGRPCGKQAEQATKGYFGQSRYPRGRQMGYVTASRYEEIVVERLYDGQGQLTQVLQSLMQAAETTLALDRVRRSRTIVRVDAGGGSVVNVNWLLARGYEYHGKDYSGPRVANLIREVTRWVRDAHDPTREVGWVATPTDLYCRPVRRIAVRCRKKNGLYGYGVILSSLTPALVLALTGQAPPAESDEAAVLRAYVSFYDQRGGGIEIDIKQDKQGLATPHRNKKRFAAQEVLLQLEALAHNTLIWARRWLAPHCPKIANFGLLRLVRDVLQMNGKIVSTHLDHVVLILLNQADPLAKELQAGLAVLLAEEQIEVILGET